MNQLPMLDNIFAQPESHRRLLAHHGDGGRAAISESAKQLRGAKGNILFSGMGASLFAAIPAAAMLVASGCPALVVESSELLHYGSAALRSSDVGVLISRSGGSVEVLRLAEKMRAAGMTVVGVTNVPGSRLDQLADVTLLIGSAADQLIAIQTYTGTALSLLLLAAETAHGGSSELSRETLSFLPTLDTWIRECFTASDQWSDLMEREGPLYLLGRGAALAAAQEGALLLHETAKASAVTMSCGQFRHGPVEYISGESRVVVFGSPQPTRELDRSLVNDLHRMGAKAFWLGPSVGGDNPEQAPSLMEWPEIPAALAPIFEIVPLQLVAYQLALWRGVVPGDFRYASEVTDAESGFPLFHARLASA